MKDNISFITLALAKKYTDEHSGGGSVFCGNIDQTTPALPTTRPDGSPLDTGDYVKVANSAILPFTVDGLTFTTKKDQAVYIGDSWVLNASAFQDTQETPLKDKTIESYTQTATKQSQVNIENADFINTLKAIIEVTELPTTDIKEESAYHLTTSTDTYPAGYYYYNGTEWVCIYSLSVDGIDLTKIEDYLYLVNYEKADYEKALNYFETRFHNSTWDGETPFGGCTAIRKGNTFGRNYDWYYNECVSFVVRREGGNGWYSYLGTTGGLKAFKKDDVASRKWIDDYDILPFFILDGVNEHGVSVSVNVVPTGDKGITTGTQAGLSGDNICMLMLPAYVLGKFDTAQGAVNWILNTAKIYAPKNATMQQELHFMIADGTKTYVVEFINNVATATEQDYMTNFYIDGVSFNTDGKVINSTVTQYGQGLERYNYIVENTEQPISDLMQNLFYTNAYKDVVPRWNTEFTGNWAEQGLPYPNLTVTSPSADFDGIIADGKTRYENRSRDESSPNYGTWQTVNSCIYDIEKKTLKIRVQEQEDKVSMFSLFDTSQTTEDIDVSNSATESYTGTAEKQAEINIENADFINNLRAVIEVTELPSTDIKLTAIYHLTADTATNRKGYYYHNGTVWTAISSKTDIIDIADTQTVEGYTVPDLQAEEINAIYEAYTENNNVIIKDSADNYYSINEVDTSVTDLITVQFMYKNQLIFRFTLDTTDDSVTSTYKFIGDVIKHITLTASSGTLTDEQYGILSEQDLNYIIYQDKLFKFKGMDGDYGIYNVLTGTGTEINVENIKLNTVTKEYVYTGNSHDYQDLITITALPSTLDTHSLYRVSTEFTDSGITYKVGLYQVINGKLYLIDKVLDFITLNATATTGTLTTEQANILVYHFLISYTF